MEPTQIDGATLARDALQGAMKSKCSAAGTTWYSAFGIRPWTASA